MKMLVNNIEEENFFLSHLKKDMRVLEWGAGSSTLAIASLVRELVSIEHNEKWYKEIKAKIPENVKLFFVPPNSEPKPEYDDGTYEDFKNYIEAPIMLNNVLAAQPLTSNLELLTSPKFDLIFIDGRARVACAEVCRQISHANTLVFIHDFNHPVEKWRRPEYYEAEKYLERIEGVFTMWKFKIKF